MNGPAIPLSEMASDEIVPATAPPVSNVQLVGRSIDCTDPDPCPADIDGSGDVDTNDLLAVIEAWGLPGGDADIDGDGTVGTDDLLALIASWGPC